jgi:hypothetical protein
MGSSRESQLASCTIYVLREVSITWKDCDGVLAYVLLGIPKPELIDPILTISLSMPGNLFIEFQIHFSQGSSVRVRCSTVSLHASCLSYVLLLQHGF